MTKRDYELVAQVIREHREHSVNLFAVRFADVLEKHNPRFDREKFLKACLER